jgi:hypothetical protein
MSAIESRLFGDRKKHAVLRSHWCENVLNLNIPRIKVIIQKTRIHLAQNRVPFTRSFTARLSKALI